MKFRTFLLSVFALLTATFSFSQSLSRPKLVVGIVVDQMRWDFLYRYYSQYSSGGFKRLITEGFNAENTMLPYLPTYTAVGHSCIYSGSVPAISGIIGNNWYLKNEKKEAYCTDDDSVETVGADGIKGKMSPKNMAVTTITDELRIAQNFKNKTIGIALKDRGAILPAGHTANAAYWFDDASGNWISSTFYFKDRQLPKWVEKFNKKNRPEKLMDKDWKLSMPEKHYTQSTEDNKEYEEVIGGEDKPVFPHKTSNIKKEKRNATMRQTPYGNTLTMEMAKAAIEGENLGEGDFTDFLAVSFSSTDYIGHAFGPNSIEIQDTYLRLDKEFESLFGLLDEKYGKDYVVFLTADHGVAHVAGFANEHNIPSGKLKEDNLEQQLNAKASEKYNSNKLIEKIINNQIYYNHAALQQANIPLNDFNEWVIGQLLTQPFVQNAVVLKNIATSTIAEPIKTMLTNGYNQSMSGDIQFIAKPQYMDGEYKGTTHGAWNPYDTHIPLIFMGKGIKQGLSHRETYMTDIAPTLAALLKVQMPNGCIGKVITEALK